MRLSFWFWWIFLGTLTAGAQDFLNCHFVPGWEQSGERRQYTPDNLYDYKDGGAEGYLLFGFARMEGIDCKSGSTVISIDVSEMSDADSAYGMFAANRDPKQPIAKIGMGGQLLRQSLIFAKGRYFVEIVETDGKEPSDQSATIAAFTARIEPLLAGRATPPDALQWFPTEASMSVRLVPESVLGLRILKRGYVATYGQGQAFVVAESSPEAAAAVMKQLRARWTDAASVSISNEALAVKAPYLDGLCIFRKGRYVAGYTNQPGVREAEAKAVELSKRLP